MAAQAASSRMTTDMEELRAIALRSESQWADARAKLVVLVATLSHREQSPDENEATMGIQLAAIRSFAHDAESIITSSAMQVTGTTEGHIDVQDSRSAISTSYMTALTSATAGILSPNTIGSDTGLGTNLPFWSSHTIQELGKLNNMTFSIFSTC